MDDETALPMDEQPQHIREQAIEDAYENLGWVKIINPGRSVIAPNPSVRLNLPTT